ncbi:hypothetical protein AAHE18_14G157200 [Arachis hypogaea]
MARFPPIQRLYLSEYASVLSSQTTHICQQTKLHILPTNLQIKGGLGYNTTLEWKIIINKIIYTHLRRSYYLTKPPINTHDYSQSGAALLTWRLMNELHTLPAIQQKFTLPVCFRFIHSGNEA